MKTNIQPKHQVPKQVQEIVTNRIDACRQALQNPDPHQGIHEARKQLKKIRAMVRIVRDATPKEDYQRINIYFRDVGRLLSDARDTAALLEVAMTLHEEVKDPPLKGLLEQLVHHFMAKKSAVTRYQIHQDDLLKRTLESFASAEEYVQSLSIEHRGFDTIAQSIQRVYQRGQRMKEKSRQHPSPENFHEWRKRVKYLRYQLNAISPIWPPMMNLLEDELHRLTDALGADHDLFMLHESILQSTLPEKADWRPLFHFIATQRKRQQARACVLGDQLYHWKPSHFIDWLNAIWAANLVSEPALDESVIEV